MFSTYPKTKFNFLVTFILSSAKSLKLDCPTILLFGKELNLDHTMTSFNTPVIEVFWKHAGPYPDTKFSRGSQGVSRGMLLWNFFYLKRFRCILVASGTYVQLEIHRIFYVLNSVINLSVFIHNFCSGTIASHNYF